LLLRVVAAEKKGKGKELFLNFFFGKVENKILSVVGQP